MAGKVNTRFVVLLGVGLVAVFGLLAWGFVTLAFKSGGDYERLGDAAMQEGDFYRAQRMYGRAVGKDTTNAVWLEKWVDAMEAWTPDTETAYQNAFFREYMGAINQVAMAQQTNLEAHERLLGLMHFRLNRGYSRGLADQIADMTTTAASYFERSADPDPSWRRLLRYRGMAMEMVQQSQGVLTEGQVSLIGEDLRAALEADPADGEAAAALVRWVHASATHDVPQDLQEEAAKKGRAEGIAIAEAFLAATPGDPDVELMLLGLRADGLLAEARQTVESARTAAIVEALGALTSDLDRIELLMLGRGPERIDMRHVARFQRLERAIDGGARLARTRRVLDEYLRQQPENGELLTLAAASARLAGDLDAALAHLEAVSELPRLPLSVTGLQRFELQRSALITRADITLDMHERTPKEDAARREELVATATALRDEFKGQVSEDNLGLMLLDGRLAAARDDLTEALRLFKRFNEQTQNQNADGLWYEARTALLLGQTGTARTALMRQLEQDRFNVRTLLVLADTELRLQETGKAAELYRQVLNLDPGNEIAISGLQRIQSVQNPDEIEDPVVSVVTRARLMRSGSEGVPADPAGAASLLEESLEALNYDPRLTLELVTVRVDMGDVAGGRALVAEAARRHPEHRVLAELEAALESGDAVAARMRMIEVSDRDEADKLAAIASVALTYGRLERLDEALARLEEIAPEHRQYIDIAFVRALNLKQTDRARALAERAERLNLDRVRGLSYRARMATAAGERGEALDMLRRAAELGTGDSSIHRLLAVAQRDSGRVEDAVRSFERALEIRPDDVQTIFEYVATLARANRMEQALDVARRRQRFAMGHPPFVDLWLQLEAAAGGDEGLALAVRQRERTMEINPSDRGNRAALARMYMDQKRWDDAVTLIDQLRAEGDSIELVQLKARWFAEQGRVGTRDGLALAREEFQNHIAALPEGSARAQGHLELARFMAGRGRPDLALEAAEAAVALEDPAAMEASKLKGDLLFSIGQPGRAAEAYRAVVDAGADTADGSYRERLIESYIRSGDHAAALAEFEKLPAERRESQTGVLQRAEIAGAMGDHAAERRLLDEAVAKFPREAFVYVKRAQSMLNDPALARDALSDLDTALTLRPGDWRALRVRAAVYFQQDRRRDALGDLREALRANPSLDDVAFGLVNELLNDSRPGEAAAVAAEVADKRSNDAPLAFEFGRLFEARELWDRAADMYGRAWRARRGPNDGAKYIDMLLRRSPPDTATAGQVIRDLTALAGGNIETSPGLLAANAMVLRARGSEEFALQQMTKALELSFGDDAQMMNWATNVARLYRGMTPDSEINYLRTLRTRYTDARARAWLDLFVAQRRLSHGIATDEAAAEMERLATLQVAPEAVRRAATRAVGAHLYGAGRYEEALALWRRALELTPDDWELNNNAAYTLSAKLGRHEEALAMAEKAVAAAPAMSEPYDTMAAVYLGLGRPDEAQQMLDRGLAYSRTVHSRASMTVTQAKVHLARGDAAAARESLEQARATLGTVSGGESQIEQEIQAVERQIGSAG